MFPGTTWGYISGINMCSISSDAQIHESGADHVYDGANYESFQCPDWTGWTTLDDINDAGVLAGKCCGRASSRDGTSTDKGTVFVGRA